MSIGGSAIGASVRESVRILTGRSIPGSIEGSVSELARGLVGTIRGLTGRSIGGPIGGLFGEFIRGSIGRSAIVRGSVRMSTGWSIGGSIGYVDWTVIRRVDWRTCKRVSQSLS